MYRYYRARFIPSALWRDLTPAEWLVSKLAHNLYMPNSTWLVSRELTESAGPWDSSMLVDDDGEYFCRVLLQSDGVRFVPEAKIYYRVSGSQSLSNLGQSREKIESQFRSVQLHIGYLRSLQDDQLARQACLTLLQNNLSFFYPERPDIVRQAGELARSLGGQLEPPRLSWKYSWMSSIFGRRAAKRIQLFLLSLRRSMSRHFDKMMYRIEKRALA